MKYEVKTGGNSLLGYFEPIGDVDLGTVRVSFARRRVRLAPIAGDAVKPIEPEIEDKPKRGRPPKNG